MEEPVLHDSHPTGIHILIGVASALAILLPVAIVWFTRFRKRDARLVGGQVVREKLKSDIILAAIQDGVTVISADGTIQAFNPSACKLLGWKDSEAIGLDYRLVMKLLDDKGQPVKDEESPFGKVFSAKTAVRDDSLFLATRSDKRLSLAISISPLLDSEGNVTAVVAIFRDISEEKKEQLRRAEFISTASHEMRTPVAAIEGYLALALNENVSKVDLKAREYLTKAHASTEHLGRLFQDLLTSAKAEDGRLANHPVVVEMGKFVEQLAEDLKFAADKKGLGVEYIVGTPQTTIDASNPTQKVIRPLYYAYIDPERIREVATNIFDNAIKYTESGKISIGITGDDQVIQLRVTDTGTGIAPEDMPHLFDKFYRIDNSATRTIGGTGLGLFICRKIVELYNGRIWGDSTPGKGSTFYVNLPRLSTQKAAQLQAAQKASSVLDPVNVASNGL